MLLRLRRRQTKVCTVKTNLLTTARTLALGLATAASAAEQSLRLLKAHSALVHCMHAGSIELRAQTASAHLDHNAHACSCSSASIPTRRRTCFRSYHIFIYFNPSRSMVDAHTICVLSTNDPHEYPTGM